MKKYIIICIYTLSTLVAFADYENYSSENVSGQNFSEGSHNNSTWDKAIAVETIFSTAESATSYENSSFKSADLSYAEFIAANLTGANLDGADFTGARLDYTILKDSIITNANFTESVKRGINWDVISTTKSFKDKNLSGIILDSNNLTGWDLSNQNLTDSSFKNEMCSRLSKLTISRGVSNVVEYIMNKLILYFEDYKDTITRNIYIPRWI